MKQHVKDTINGYGLLFRFITPILISIAIYLLTTIRTEVTKLDNHFTNHLTFHKTLEKEMEHRFTYLETLIKQIHK